MSTFSDLPPFRRWGMLPAEDRPARTELAEACAALVRGLLQTSYYSPDHPHARAAVQEVWERLQYLRDRLPEITFVTTWADDVETIALDGVFADQVPLAQLLLGANAQPLAAKLHTFCARARVVSLAVKTSIGEEEFHKFVATFVERHVAASTAEHLTAGDGGHWLGDALYERGIVHVSVIVQEDLVEERRALPWRVRLALTRLHKDLRAVPLYRSATAEARRAAKLQVLQDILRPLGMGQFLHQLFANVDLIAEQIVEFQGLDLERDLVAALSYQRVLAVGDSLLTDWARGTAGVQVHDREGQQRSMKRLLARIAEPLAEVGDEDERAGRLLRRMQDRGAVALSVLPPGLRAELLHDRWAKKFAENPAEHLQRIDAMREPEAYRTAVDAVLEVLPDLISDHHFAECRQVLAMIRQHKEPGGFTLRTATLTVALQGLDQDEAGRRMVEVITTQSGDEQARALATDLLVTLGRAGLPLALEILDVSERTDVVNEVSVALVEQGEEIAGDICELLDERRVRPTVAAYLLRVLGHIGAPESTRTVVSYIDHPRPAVRDAALESSWKLGGPRSRPVLVKAVSDKDPGVAIHAVRHLEQLNHSSHPYLARLLTLAEERAEEPNEAHDNLRAAAITALARRGDLPLADGGSVLDRLLALLPAPVHGISRLAVWRHFEEAEVPEVVRLAVVDAIAALGDIEDAKRLEDDSGEHDGVVKERMHRAAAAIRSRITREEREDYEL